MQVLQEEEEKEDNRDEQHTKDLHDKPPILGNLRELLTEDIMSL